jgi:hypothetical protein
MYFESFGIEHILKSPFLYEIMTQVMKAREQRCNEIGLGPDCLVLNDIGFCKTDKYSLDTPGIFLSYTKEPRFQYLEKVLVRASFFEDDIKKIMEIPLTTIKDSKSNQVILHTSPNF